MQEMESKQSSTQQSTDTWVNKKVVNCLQKHITEGKLFHNMGTAVVRALCWLLLDRSEEAMEGTL